MGAVVSAITDTIPITQFNRGLAGKIFEEVRNCGAKVVMKNNSAECVLLSPTEYLSLIDELDDARLMSIASQRLNESNPDKMLSEAEVNTQLGISAEDLSGFEGVEIE